MSTHNVLFSTLAGILLLSACSTDYFVQTEGNLPSKNDVLALKQGMSQEEVRKIMGSPSVISSLDHRTWLYMNTTMKRMAFFEPEELERNLVAVRFNQSGKLERVVELTKEDGKDIDVSQSVTPVLGSEETFMEKYFGGVGYYMPIEPSSNQGL
jgi:outer membrane protein assembly factor BamE (lipoprotein component of BamABCDE complex)